MIMLWRGTESGGEGGEAEAEGVEVISSRYHRNPGRAGWQSVRSKDSAGSATTQCSSTNTREFMARALYEAARFVPRTARCMLGRAHMYAIGPQLDMVAMT